MTNYTLDLPTLSAEIKQDIEDATSERRPGDDGRRTYLGASVIGHECKAALWFGFRWVTPVEEFSGRQLRLFERGHLEEIRINGWMRKAGWKVYDTNPETNKQWQFSAVDGHFGGSCDKLLEHPEKYPYLGRILGEDKTHSTKNFMSLINKGMQLAMPKHASQMHIYGTYFQVPYGLYFPVNKNDDDIRPELMTIDANEARKLVMKAEEIISSKVRPGRVSETPTYFACRYCTHVGACHSGHGALKSCRSCAFATPAPGGTWTCDNYNMTIPEDFMKLGCDLWKQVTY